MSTYAALLSLHRILEALIDLQIYDRAQLQSIDEKVTSLLDSLEIPGSETSSSTDERNARLREAAYKAEDVIESRVSTILCSDRKRSMDRKTYCFILCAIGVLAYVCPQNPEGMVDWIKIFLVFVGVVYLWSGYIIRDILTRLKYYIFDKVSRAERDQDLTLVFNDFNLIEENYESQISAYATLVSLQRTLDSALGSDEYDRPHLESLHGDVSFLLETYFRRQESAPEATIRYAAYNALTKFLVLALKCFDRIIILLFDALSNLITALAVWLDSPRAAPFIRELLQIGRPTILLEEAPFWPTVFYSEEEQSKRLRLAVDDLVEGVNNACGDQDSQKSSSPRRELGNSNVVVGLERDLQQIKDHLLRDSSQREVISIVGMGGIGKTTLAALAYNDSAIRSHFDIRAWVSVSQEYSLRRVLLCILDSANLLTKEMQEEGDDGKLGVHLHKSLVSRRYLIVMDDVWDTKIWDSVRVYFPEYYKGSRILLTSRIIDAAPRHLNSSSLHQMQYLNNDQSWCLLREKVFGEQDRPLELELELESTGKEIAEKCRGLPLAIVVIGGLLYKDNRRETWTDVARNLNLNLQAQVSEILGLSYNHLPHHLRPCFLYMGAFPGDAEITVSKLIRLWVAEGFLKHDRTSQSLEETAEEYLNELNDRNLILVGKRSCNGKIRTCSIHDLLKDVCVQNAQKENFLQVGSSGQLIPQSCGRTTRRLSICIDALLVSAIHDELVAEPDENIRSLDAKKKSTLTRRTARKKKRTRQGKKQKKVELEEGFSHELTGSYYVRSLLCTAGKPANGPSLVYLACFMYLRVLDLVVICFREFPDSVLELIHLRYLAFRSNSIDPIPPTISKLWNLQTISYHCSPRRYPLLPGVIWSMPNLRHLYVKPGCYLSHPLGFQFPWKISLLQHLQTLMGIRNFKWSKGIIKRIPNLKKLGIFYDVSSSVDWSTYQLECLFGLSQLEVLKITVNYDDLQSCDPPKLAFPQKLKKLSLRGCGIPWASMTTIGALPNLEALKLRHEACSGPSWKTVEGEFPKLMFLLLENISFESWETDEHHFPLLQRLVIRSCGKLSEIPRAIGDIPTLEMIELVACHPSAVVSAKEVQEEQEGMGNDLKVHIC